MNDLQVLLKLQGRNTAEIQEATQAAQRIAAKNPNISVVDAMKAVIDVADTGDRDMKKAARLAPIIAQSAKMVALVGDGAMKKNLGEDQSRYLGRALEDTGKGTKSESEIKSYVDAITAGTIATRGIFNPKELFQTIQKSGGTARGWSNEFTGEVLPALTMAMGGSGAGDATYMFSKSFVKGQMQLSSAKAMMEMGLINKKDLLYDGKKYLGVRPDSMPNAEGFRTNQYDAFRNTVVPAALKKAGITDIGATRQRFYQEHGNDTDLAGLSGDDRKVKLIDKFKEFLDNELQKGTDTFAKAKNFSKQIADFIAQNEQIQAMREQIRRQPKNATEIMTGENFTAQLDKLQSTFHTLMTALGAPEVGTAITAMDQIAGAMGKLAVAAASDPGATQKAMAGIAAVTAGIASLGTIALAGPVIGAMASLGPFGLAVGAVAAALAAWAVLDFDGFSESMGKLLAIGQALKATLDFLGSIGDDAKGNSLIGKAVSAMLGNNSSSNSEEAYLEAGKRRDAAKARLDTFDPRARGAFPGQRAGLEDDLKRAEAEVKAQGDANVAYAERKRRTQEREAKAMKMVSDADQKVKDATDRANAVRAMQEHAEHSDADLTKRVQEFKPKEQREPVTKSIRYGDKPAGAAADARAKAAAPLSSENVHVTNPVPSPIQAMNKPVPVTIMGPTPGTQGAPAIPATPARPLEPTGAIPGAAVAAGGRTVVDIAGPVSIKDEVGVKQPLRLATPVLVTAQGVLNVHDTELQGTMSGLNATLAGMAGSLGSIAANTAATVAACNAVVGAINAKQFNVTVNGGGGSTGAAKERSSFSD
ncbi:hypothetical protein MKK64_04610 [Methylobacterium sp. E-025]|uniref:hypothetical protein n=1 Tax=Methylobacterium sp. E-025 TaxID=2836561 RepID=UPI001FBBD520|nr:hypothetical protein [Methylobacterium sp. E-025]MCJ2110495.1 hypothetical protein [Methylobacterium sp. E-025]